jgi:hypothetical protein
MDVFLELPKGASENAAAAAPGKDASQTDKATHPQKPQGETAPAEHGDAAAKHTSSRHHHASSASAASQPEQPHESAKPESTTAAKPIEKPAGVKLPTGAEASAQRGGTPAVAPPPQKPAIPDNPF